MRQRQEERGQSMSGVHNGIEKPQLNEKEYTTIADVLKRFGGEGITDYEGGDIFRFANYSYRGFLKELPIVVDILARHRNEGNFGYEDFVRSLKFVAEAITDISEYRFCLMPLSDMCDAMFEVREKQEKERLEAEFGKGV